MKPLLLLNPLIYYFPTHNDATRIRATTNKNKDVNVDVVVTVNGKNVNNKGEIGSSADNVVRDAYLLAEEGREAGDAREVWFPADERPPSNQPAQPTHHHPTNITHTEPPQNQHFVDQNPPLAGGWTPHYDNLPPEVQKIFDEFYHEALKDWIVDKYKRESKPGENEALKDKKKFALRIVSYETQVVAGINYKLQIAIELLSGLKMKGDTRQLRGSDVLAAYFAAQFAKEEKQLLAKGQKIPNRIHLLKNGNWSDSFVFVEAILYVRSWDNYHELLFEGRKCVAGRCASEVDISISKEPTLAAAFSCTKDVDCKEGFRCVESIQGDLCTPFGPGCFCMKPGLIDQHSNGQSASTTNPNKPEHKPNVTDPRKPAKAVDVKNTHQNGNSSAATEELSELFKKLYDKEKDHGFKTDSAQNNSTKNGKGGGDVGVTSCTTDADCSNGSECVESLQGEPCKYWSTDCFCCDHCKPNSAQTNSAQNGGVGGRDSNRGDVGGACYAPCSTHSDCTKPGCKTCWDTAYERPCAGHDSCICSGNHNFYSLGLNNTKTDSAKTISAPTGAVGRSGSNGESAPTTNSNKKAHKSNVTATEDLAQFFATAAKKDEAVAAEKREAATAGRSTFDHSFDIDDIYAARNAALAAHKTLSGRTETSQTSESLLRTTSNEVTNSDLDSDRSKVAEELEKITQQVQTENNLQNTESQKTFDAFLTKKVEKEQIQEVESKTTAMRVALALEEMAEKEIQQIKTDSNLVEKELNQVEETVDKTEETFDEQKFLEEFEEEVADILLHRDDLKQEQQSQSEAVVDESDHPSPLDKHRNFILRKTTTRQQVNATVNQTLNQTQEMFPFFPNVFQNIFKNHKETEKEKQKQLDELDEQFVFAPPEYTKILNPKHKMYIDRPSRVAVHDIGRVVKFSDNILNDDDEGEIAHEKLMNFNKINVNDASKNNKLVFSQVPDDWAGASFVPHNRINNTHLNSNSTTTLGSGSNEKHVAYKSGAALGSATTTAGAEVAATGTTTSSQTKPAGKAASKGSGGATTTSTPTTTTTPSQNSTDKPKSKPTNTTKSNSKTTTTTTNVPNVTVPVPPLEPGPVILDTTTTTAVASSAKKPHSSGSTTSKPPTMYPDEDTSTTHQSPKAPVNTHGSKTATTTTQQYQPLNGVPIMESPPHSNNVPIPPLGPNDPYDNVTIIGGNVSAKGEKKKKDKGGKNILGPRVGDSVSVSEGKQNQTENHTNTNSQNQTEKSTTEKQTETTKKQAKPHQKQPLYYVPNTTNRFLAVNTTALASSITDGLEAINVKKQQNDATTAMSNSTSTNLETNSKTKLEVTEEAVEEELRAMFNQAKVEEARIIERPGALSTTPLMNLTDDIIMSRPNVRDEDVADVTNFFSGSTPVKKQRRGAVLKSGLRDSSKGSPKKTKKVGDKRAQFLVVDRDDVMGDSFV